MKRKEDKVTPRETDKRLTLWLLLQNIVWLYVAWAARSRYIVNTLFLPSYGAIHIWRQRTLGGGEVKIWGKSDDA